MGLFKRWFSKDESHQPVEDREQDSKVKFAVAINNATLRHLYRIEKGRQRND
jgi:hypothetical protein